jgi:hypothetical protein
MIAADRRKQRLEEKVKNLSVGLKREIKAREGMCMCCRYLHSLQEMFENISIKVPIYCMHILAVLHSSVYM